LIGSAEKYWWVDEGGGILIQQPFKAQWEPYVPPAVTVKKYFEFCSQRFLYSVDFQSKEGVFP
jgi:hypothetical protein